MIIGLQITKNKDKYKKLVSLLNKNEFKGISFVHISDYKSSSNKNYNPTRTRKILLSKKEQNKIIGSTNKQGYSVIPIS